MTKQEKNLSFSQIKKENAKSYKDKKRIHFDNGSKLDIDVVFRPSKQEKVVQELLSLLLELYKRGVNLEPSDYVGLATVLIIKNFTTLETDASDLDGYIELIEGLKDGHYFDKIMESFDVKQVNSTLDKATEAMKQVSENLDKLSEEELAKVAADVVNDSNAEDSEVNV